MQPTNDANVQPVLVGDDGLSLLDVLNFIINGWKTIGSTTVIGLMVGISYAILAPEKYQADVIIQGALVAGQSVESPAVTVEKLKQPTYYSQETLTQCDLRDSATAFSSLAKDLKPTLNKTAPVISLSYTAKSPELGKSCLESVITDIGKDQQRIAEPLIQMRKDQLANTQTKLALADETMKQLGGKRLNFDIPDQKFSASTVFYSIILSKQNEIADLRKSVETQTIELSAPQTQPASAATPIYAPSVRVSPKRSAAIVGAVFGGALLGILWLLAQRAWIKIKLQLSNKLLNIAD